MGLNRKRMDVGQPLEIIRRKNALPPRETHYIIIILVYYFIILYSPHRPHQLLNILNFLIISILANGHRQNI